MIGRKLAYAAVALCAWCGALVLTCPSAFGEKIYYPGVSFGEPGSGPGQFKEPVGVAVNDATGLEAGEGDVYVVDSGNDRVERFSSSGVYLGQFNGSGTYEVEGKEVKHGTAAPSGAFQEPEQIVVDNCTNQLLGTTCTTAEDPSVGDVYVTDKAHKVVDKFSATGEYLGQLTEMKVCRNGSAPCKVAPFSQLGGLAVDSAGNLWVEEGFPEYEPIENKHFLPFYMDEFSSSGVPERAVAGYDKELGRGGMVVEPNGDFNVISFDGQLKHAEVQVFEVAGEAREGLSNSSIDFGYGTTALAIVPSTSSQLAGDVLADYGGSILLYAPIVEREQHPLETFPGKTVPKGYEGLSGSDGLAMNASATVYASEHAADRIEIFEYASVPHVITEPPSGVSETALRLHGSVNPGGEAITECYFEYGTEVGNYTGGAVACKQTPGAVNENVPVEAELSELVPAQARSFRLVAVNKAGIAKVGNGITITRPITTDEAVSEAGSSTATVSAQIDAGGLASCYWFEFGTSTSYGGKTAESCVGPGEDEKAKAELADLQPDTVYHFRIQARNDLGVKAGEDRLFTTFPPSGAGLPDGRVYEPVSSVGTGGETNVYVPVAMMEGLDSYGVHGLTTPFPFQAAPGGDAVAFVGDPPATGGNGNDGIGGGNQYVARRTSGGGWAQVDVDQPGYSSRYVALSGDLSVGVDKSGEKLAEDAPVEMGTDNAYVDLYGRSLGWRATAAGSLEPSLGSFEPLIAATPPCTVSEFGGDFDNTLEEPLFGGGNAGTAGVPAFSHIVVEADVALPATPPTVTPRSCMAGGELEDDLYDVVEGQLYLVNVLPDGRPQAGATVGRQGPDVHGRSPDIGGAVSADGSRIYWSAVEPVEVSNDVFEERPKALYVRENDTDPEGEHGECGEFLACTVQVDLSALPGNVKEKETKGGYGKFWTASSDGSRVFFTDEKPLTKEATAGPGAPDLYEYDLQAPEGEQLSDLSVPVDAGPGVHADVQGVVGSSEDGSYVYFVADGVLSEGASAEGGEPAPGELNLYVRHGGMTRFIATLSQEEDDFTNEAGYGYGDWQADPGLRTAQVAADGQSVVFMSRLTLTGYDNELGGGSLTEVFVYDAETGRLTCASCNPSGEAPVAPDPELLQHGLADAWGSFLPVSESWAGHQPRVISQDGGRVFFDSIEPLVPQDENGFLDVYEWERDGTGSCEQASGCIFLLSGGQSDDNSYLIDASASGDDVFFVSRAQLSKADHGDIDVLYDARVGGIEPPAKVKCSGAGCQGQPQAPPLFATPASATFAGPGNQPSGPPLEVKKVTKKTVKCKKPRKLSHGRCVRRPKAKKAKRAKRASRDRRASS
jgi:hypothetical protein